MSFKVTLQANGHMFEVPDGSTILTAGLDAGLNMPYCCRTGNSRTCRGRISYGSVDYNNTHAAYLTDEQKANGFALLCKAKPLSDLEIQLEELVLNQMTQKLVPCRIKRIAKPSTDVAVIDLRLPMNENLMFAAGQFIDFQLADGKTRSYSIATAPQPEGVHRSGVAHSTYAKRAVYGPGLLDVARGRVAAFSGATGNLLPHEDSAKLIIFLAAGTGFAPIKAMINYALKRGTKRQMVLYWGCRTQADLYMEPPPIDFVPVLSAQQWAGRTGLVHHAVLDDFPDLSGSQVYACGAPRMVSAARIAFTEQCGLSEGEFFADSFTSEADLS